MTTINLYFKQKKLKLMIYIKDKIEEIGNRRI
jgi:hypothetical protein